MKLQLDFDNKIVKVEDDVNLHDFIKVIKKLLPDWKDWSIKTDTKIEWMPYYIQYPDYKLDVTYTGDNVDYPLFTTTGYLNIEIK